MKPRQVLLSVAAVLVGAGSFWAGRATGSVTGRARPVHDAATIHRPSTTAGLTTAERVDLGAVTVENLAQVEFAHAYELLREAPPAILSQWVARLEALSSSPKKTAAIRTFFKTLAQVDARLAMECASKLRRQETRATASEAIRGAAPAAEYPTLAELAVRPGGDPTEAMWLVPKWSLHDPAAAAQFSSKHLDKLRSDEVATLIGNWAAVDPAAARAWMKDLPPSHSGADVYLGLYSGWVEADRAAAVSDLAANAGDPLREKTIEYLAVKLFLESENAATMLTNALQDSGAAALVVEKIASYSTERTITLGGPEPAEIKAESVARWAITLPESLWMEHIGEVVARWDSNDTSGAAATWVRSLPWPTRDHVAAKFCAAFDWDQPQTAFDAAFQISDRQLREEALRAAVQRTESRERAEEILNQLQLSTSDAAELKKLVMEL